MTSGLYSCHVMHYCRIQWHVCQLLTSYKAAPTTLTSSSLLIWDYSPLLHLSWKNEHIIYACCCFDLVIIFCEDRGTPLPWVEIKNPYSLNGINELLLLQVKMDTLIVPNILIVLKQNLMVNGIDLETKSTLWFSRSRWISWSHRTFWSYSNKIYW